VCPLVVAQFPGLLLVVVALVAGLPLGVAALALALGFGCVPTVSGFPPSPMAALPVVGLQ